MRAEIFHSVNSGLYIRSGGSGILIDGIHRGKGIGFSDMPPELMEDMFQARGLFAELSGLLFTHRHHDHFDRELLCRFLSVRGNPLPAIYGTCLELSNVVCKDPPGEPASFDMGNAAVTAVRTVHDGEIYKNDPHRSFLIHIGGESFFIGGDAAPDNGCADVIKDASQSGVTAAFINVYQARSPEARDFLRRLRPERLFLYHLPFPEDDMYGHLMMAKWALRNFPEDLPELEVLRHMEWTGGRAADGE